MEMHLKIKVVGRGNRGRTCCGSAAYRAGEDILGHDGTLHRYDRKQGVVDKWMMFPAGTPGVLKDRQALWAAADRAEHTRDGEWRKNCQLYRDVVAAVPNEISHTRARDLAEQFLKPLVEEGMVADVAIHDPEHEQRNLHIHIMLSLREMTPTGFGKKNRSWNRQSLADELRTRWAKLCNLELERIGSAERLEHESFEARGIDAIPTEHMGVAVTAMERRGIHTREGDKRELILQLQEQHEENLQREVNARSSFDSLIDAAKDRAMHRRKDFAGLYDLVKEASDLASALRYERARYRKLIENWSAYFDGSKTSAEQEKAASFVRWAGCDPDDLDMWDQIKLDQQEALEAYEAARQLKAVLLENADSWKWLNQIEHARSDAAWAEIRLERKNASIKAAKKRVKKLKEIQYNCYRSWVRSRDYEKAYYGQVSKGTNKKMNNYQHYNRLYRDAEEQLKKLKREKREAKAAVKETRKKRQDTELIER